MKKGVGAAHEVEGDVDSSSSDSSKNGPTPETNGSRYDQDEISSWLKAYVAKVAELTLEEIDGGKPFVDYGLTSKEAVFLSGELADWLGHELNPTLLWEHPTIEALSRHLGTARAHALAAGPAPASRQQATNDTIAIVALACRFPGAASPEAFWELLRRGEDAITEIPPSRWDAQRFYRPGPASSATMNTRWGGFLEKVDEFDPLFFGISPLEAARMDPQQRLLLEATWEALENAGQAPEALAGSRTGVFIGISSNDYAQRQFGDRALLDAYAGTGNAHSIAANRISYVLGLRGPSMAVDTACSSSLVAVHLASQSLRTTECDLAIAGGVNVILTPDLTIAFSQAGMMASDGRCKTFDAGADGYVRSEGCGVVLLKRYADAVAAGDPILAVIHGSAVNHDGFSNGLTAPSGAAQQEVIRRALQQAGLQPAQISYVEAHGTGTSLGDPIEMEALKAVLMPGRSPTQRCLVGSAKGNIGHMEAAAGIAGLTKAVLALQRGELPPQVNFRRLNPHISLEQTTFHIPTRCEPWPQAPGARFAGVSSFGFGGTNAHVILGEAAPPPPTRADVLERTSHLLTLSAKSEQALRELARRYQAQLRAAAAPPLADVCFSANMGRNHWTHRLAATAGSAEEMAKHLEDFVAGSPSLAVYAGQAQKATPPRVVFLFSGQGSQYPGMGRQLYESEPVFREAIDRCDALLRPHLEQPLTSVLYPDKEEASALLHQTLYAQPALFTLGYALAELWRSWGVKPDAVLGHSVGEYVAAHLAGMIGLEDILGLLVTRSRLMQALPRSGAMAMVMDDELTVRAVLQHEREVAIAALNGPRNVVISGEQRAVQRVTEAMQAREVSVRPLTVSHAFHSPLMEPMLDDFERATRGLVFQRPSVPLVSTLTGEWLTEAPDATYWRRHTREPVQFAKSIRTVAQLQGPTLFIELGPHDTLLGMAKRCVPEGAGSWFPSLKKKQDAWQTLFGCLGSLYVCGASVDWRAVDRPHPRRRVRLPNYPFERQRCWLETTRSTVPDGATSSAPRMTPFLPPSPNAAMPNSLSLPAPASALIVARQERILNELRSMTARLLQIPVEKLSVSASLLELGADSIVLLDAVRSVEKQFGVKLALRQLFEELTTLEALAAHLDQTLPPEAERPAVPAPASNAAPATEPSITTALPPPVLHTASSPPSAQPAHTSAPLPANGAVDQLIQMQLQVMSQQLSLLGGRAHPSSALEATVAHSLPAPAIPPGAGTAPSAGNPLTESPARAAEPDAKPSGQSPFGAGPLSGTPERELPAPQQRHLDSLITRYRCRTPRSQQNAAHYRAQWSDVRWLMNFRPELKEVCYPIVSLRSQGSRFWDVDGNEYIDLSMGFGVHLFGHSPPFIVEALRRRLDLGMELGPQSDLAGQAAALICELTGMKRVTFCNSGTEAVMTALRLARAATRRSKIVMFSGSYHGHSDGTLVVGRTVNGQLQSLPMAAGVPRQVAEDVLVLPYGEDKSLEIIRGHLNELAGVLVEPVQSRRPHLQPKAFLQALRVLTRSAGVPLIFDEVITGFRLHSGGAQAWLGIEADLVTYGKVVGGGMPIGVVADRGGFVDRIDGGDWRYGDTSYPAVETTFAAGTFCKHPLSMAATVAALTHLKQEGPALHERLNQRAAGLVQRLNEVFRREQVPIEAVHCGSVIRFTVMGNFSYLYQPLEMDVFFCHLIERGVYVWEGRTCMLSTAHTDADVDAIVRAVAETVAEMRSGGFWPGPNPPTPSPRPPRQTDVTAAKIPGGLAPTFPPAGAVSTEVVPAKASGPRGDARPGGFWDRRRQANQVSPEPRYYPARHLELSLAYFGSYDARYSEDKYRLLIESAKQADQHGFTALWLPERHFHAFGGFSPNPSVLAAALARETRRIHLRAGSVVLPLHHPVRVAEEWSVVDNLSHGRVGIGFASGWHPNDFVFNPDAFGRHRELTFEGLETVRRLWRGEQVPQKAGGGVELPVSIFPRPMQPQLPVWLTIVNNPETYVRAAELGAGVLTNLMGQSLEDLARNIAGYRDRLASLGKDPASGHVVVLMHTFVGQRLEEVREQARQPFIDYLKSSIGLFRSMVQAQGLDADSISEQDQDFIAGLAYERYVQSSALIGTPDTCAPILEKLRELGVNEVACFVDFGLPAELLLSSFPSLVSLKESSSSATSRSVPTTAARGEARTLPLTEAQQQLWILSQLNEGGSIAYHLSVHLRLEGPLRAEALHRAIQRVVERHQALRVQIAETGEQQTILPSLEIALPRHDLSALSSEERAERLTTWHAHESQVPFDLHRGPLLRAHLLKLGAMEHLLVLTTHHIVADGWSLSVILQEIAAIYSADQQGEVPSVPPPLQLEDYLQWLQRYSETEEMGAHERFWLEQRVEEVPQLELPADFSRPAQRSFRGARDVQRLDPTLTQAVKNLAQQQQSTLFMLLLSVYTTLLHRLTGQEEVLVGIPAAGRGQEGSEGLVGYCSHLLPIVSRPRADQPFSEYHSALKRVLWEAYAHQDYPFARLLNRLNLPRTAGHTPLVNVTFNLERPIRLQGMDGLQTSVHLPPIGFSPFDLSLNVAEVEDGLILDFDYSSELFSAETITRWARCFRTLLENAVAHPQQTLTDLPLLTTAERHQLLVEWNQTELQYPRDRLIHQLIKEQAASAPDQVAIEYDGQRLTFASLEQQANRLAHCLRTFGVQPGTVVGCCLERSPEVIVTLLATLKAGGAYLPLDPEHPRERLKFLVGDSRLAIVVTRERLAERLSAQHARLFCLDRDACLLSAQSPEAPENLATPTTPAYVIYTSGSTGEPKGVVVGHGALVIHCQDVERHYGLSASDRVLQFASFNFDASLEQILPTLMAGGTLVLRGPQPWPPDELARRLVEQQLTVVNLPTAAWQQLAQWWAESQPTLGEHRVRLVIVGGDTLLPRALELWRRSPLGPVRLLNAYGPTEATITATTFEVPVRSAAPSSSTRVPIGRPLANRTLYILDRSREPVPVGVPGELYIGGEVLALGYLHRPELTVQRFIADPFSDKPTARLYRTGDLARYLPDGTVEFLGRTDHQVKVRGFRIELGEIESALSRHPAVRQVVVTVDGDDSAQDKRLVAYVVPASPEGVTGAELRRHLQERLPDYMVPAFFIPLEAMPLTASGKLNRRALPPMDPAALPAARPFVAPRTPTERTLAELWSQTLRLPRVGVHDDFFELGGDSLLATRVASHLRRMLKVEVPLNSLFMETTIARLAEHLDTLVWAAQAPTEQPASPTAREEGEL